MRIFNASSINFHIYDDIIDYGHHAIYYMSKIYLVKFLFHKIWVLLVNYSHKMVVIDLPYLSHHTKSRDVCQSNLLHVGHNFDLLIKPPFSASQLRVTETDSFLRCRNQKTQNGAYGMVQSQEWRMCQM